MKHRFHLVHTLLMAAAIMVAMAASAFASAAPDWGNSTITVEGMGIAPPNVVNAVQGRMLARRAAVVDGYRQLAESINGVNVNSETTVEQMMVTSDTVRTHVDALIKGARVISERDLPGGGYAVTMQVSMFGVSNSLASAVFEPQQKIESFPAMDSKVEPSKTVTSVNINISTTADVPAYTTQETVSAAPSGKAVGNFTGLVVDCRGLGLKPVMSPVIKNADGQPIYGYKNLDIDKVIANGMAGYATDMSGASRAGSHPLYVKAIRLENHNGNPVISVADANRVLLENEATGFLNATNVVFLR